MTTITESQWVNYFGFQHFPFDRPEAGSEEFARPDFLASCFVEPKGFELVFGHAGLPKTSLLFAARGTGKTACRVMMDYYCQNGLTPSSFSKSNEPNYVLSVPHLNLENVRDFAELAEPNVSPPKISLKYHAVEIMRQAVPVFVDMVAKHTEFINRIKRLQKFQFKDLSSFLVSYSSYLTTSQKEFLGDLGVDMQLQELESLPLHHLKQWAKLMPTIGIKATYVLVDGVDELTESASDPNYAYYLIKHLLTNLTLMDKTPYLALKFFLPSDMEQIVLSDPDFRRDRGFEIQKMHWEDDDLIRILRERLNVLRRTDFEIGNQTAAGFDTLCVPELRGEIERNLAHASDGNPRYLMNLCSQMVTAHCAREIEHQDDPFQLNREDYFSAIEFVKFRYRNLSSILNDLQIEEESRSDTTKPEPAVYESGQIIDSKYEVRKLLPPGGFGQVYSVYDEVFERMCALKIFNNSSVSENSFKTEARLLLNLSHPNIVRVYDWGILRKSGRFYLLSEFVDGNELTNYTNPGNLLPLQKAIQIILELLSALEYLHPDTDRLNDLRDQMRDSEIDEQVYEEYSRLREQGLFHRDIKPSNMVLSSSGVKLIDFNIASRAITVGQTFSGTLSYMLPEIGSTPWTADGDLFAAGIVLYELVTGYHPYPDRRPMADVIPVDPLQYMPDVNPDLADVIWRAVSCNPEIRYHSAKKFLKDLLVADDKHYLT
jgi:serine/threonine protein kinase